jgi:probable rRNA maturation factor
MDDSDLSRRPSSRAALRPSAVGAATVNASAVSASASGATSFRSEIDVSFVSDAEIAEMNTHHRHKPRPTDVLSFSQLEGEAFPVEMLTDPLPLGDLVISIETAARQAAERHHSLTTEISFLAVHGTLHLLGYDHVTSAQRRAMWKQQEAIVQLLQESEAAAGRAL